MNMEFFARALAEICGHSLIAGDRPLRWIIIANPGAGGFVMPLRWKKSRDALEDCRMVAKINPMRENCQPAATAAQFGAEPALAACGLIQTQGPDSAAKIANALIKEASADNISFFLLITAGGDGTSHGALSVLCNAPASVRSNIVVLRLPMGTGNDGADSPHLANALELLIKPSRIEFAPAIQLLPSPSGRAKGPFLAFNILSVGLDAFVTHMTNKMKEKLPGDFYKLWVDIASLLYDRLYTVGFLDVRALDEQNKVVRSFRERILLLAVGASGYRTYGSQKKILPDKRNVCALRQMSLLRKVALKGLFTTGEHIGKPEAMMFNARRVEISGSHPILAQMDGETVLLHKEDFPIAIELTGPVIPILKLS
jgi:diacylglycerol kinase family enzyme